MAAGDNISTENLDQLVKKHMAFLIRTTSHFTGKYVSIENDEEFSIALMAFTEAVTKYDEDRGNFLGFAKLVIESRLKTYLWKKRNESSEVSLEAMQEEGIDFAEEKRRRRRLAGRNYPISGRTAVVWADAGNACGPSAQTQRYKKKSDNSGGDGKQG